MPRNELLARDQIVNLLQRSMADGSYGLKSVPQLIKKIIDEKSWRHRFCEKCQKEVEFKSFEEFVTTPLIEGLGATVQILKNLCRDDLEAIDSIDQETVKGPGQPTKESIRYNITNSPERGTAAQYAIRKLRKSAPELHARVLAGELSPHRAMIQAGFRKAGVTIPLDPEGAARTIQRRFTSAQIRKLKELL